MKSLIACLFSFIPILILAQIPGNSNLKTRTQSLGMFSILKVEFPAEVEIVCQSLPHLEITTDANLFSYIKIEPDGNSLRVYATDNLNPSQGIQIKIGTAFLHELETGYLGEYSVKNLNTPQFKLQNLSSSATLEGETKELRIMSETGNTDATQLSYDKAYVNVWSTGKIHVQGGEYLEAWASQDGQVIYEEEPRQLKTHKKSGGKVISREEVQPAEEPLKYFDLTLQNNSAKKIDIIIKGPSSHPFGYGAPFQPFQKRKEHFPVGTKIYLEKPVGKTLLLTIGEEDEGQTLKLFNREY